MTVARREAPAGVADLAATGIEPRPVVVLTDQASVPDWALAWCRHSGRMLRVQRANPLPGPASHSPGVSGLNAIAGLAGTTVLVTRPVPRDDSAVRVLAALRHLPDDQLVLDYAAEITTQLRGILVLAHAVPWSFAERSVGLDAALDRGRHLVEAAAEQLSARAPDLPVQTRLLRAHPHELTGEGLDADLLVLGGPRSCRPEALGTVIRNALFHAPCPVLLVPHTSHDHLPKSARERPPAIPAGEAPRFPLATVRTGQDGQQRDTAVDDVDEAGLESFPASDPPSWWAGPTAATPPPPGHRYILGTASQDG